MGSAFIGMISAKDSRADNSNFQTLIYSLIHDAINPVSPIKGKTKANRLQCSIAKLGVQTLTRIRNCSPKHPKTAENPHKTAPFNLVLTKLIRMVVNDSVAVDRVYI